MRSSKGLIFTTFSVLALLPVLVQAQDVLGQETVFNIESNYDLYQRTELTAVLIRNSPTAYWYIDKNFWSNLNVSQQSAFDGALVSLAEEFETNIYPVLTRSFGSEWTPGIDKDTRITILIHPMTKETGGYGDTADEYPKVQIPESNEKEMLYLNSQYIESTYAKSFLAHEFVHLISFNQKNRPYGVNDDIWLQEARSEYAPTLLGYDNLYEGSNLQRRVRDFLDKPSDSLTEWRETPNDYGIVNLFTQYLVDHYGIQVLTDSLKIKETGIQSINLILSQKGFKENFAQIFMDWTVAVLINNCQVSEKYCYFNQNLKDFRVTPLVNYLPFSGESVLSVTNSIRDWSGNWHKFIGGSGTLKVEFTGIGGATFKVPYVIQGMNNELTVNNLALNYLQTGQILINDFGSENVISLTIIPVTQIKTAGFSGVEPSRMFSWTASTQQAAEIVIPSLTPLSKPISQMSRTEILSRIAEIQALIIKLQEIIIKLGGEASCKALSENLYFGLANNSQVRCLQQILKNQGTSIYPEGIVNGNFFSATQAAVIRFQEKYGIPGTGFVGPLTRAKINTLLTK